MATREILEIQKDTIACIISIIIDGTLLLSHVKALLMWSCISKQTDLTWMFVITAALLCKHVKSMQIGATIMQVLLLIGTCTKVQYNSLTRQLRLIRRQLAGNHHTTCWWHWICTVQSKCNVYTYEPFTFKSLEKYSHSNCKLGGFDLLEFFSWWVIFSSLTWVLTIT